MIRVNEARRVTDWTKPLKDCQLVKGPLIAEWRRSQCKDLQDNENNQTENETTSSPLTTLTRNLISQPHPLGATQ